MYQLREAVCKFMYLSIFRILVGRCGSVVVGYDRPGARGGGGTPYIKGVGMLVVSLRGVNFGFWSRLKCSGQNTIRCSR